ncbi:hypothetical protein [Dactylosporangium sp. NPDC051484]|uniref:hypothetical protein n=1 Tax=Dactylosporangium sp. NPDC051484 TaxID=3154942 RepID=UPI00344E2D25
MVRDPRRAARAPWWLWPIPLCGLALWPIASAAGLLVAAALLLAVAVVVRRRTGGGIRLTGGGARDWRDAEALLAEIARRWPSLGAMAEPSDIRPTLERTAYHLAKLIGARARLDGYTAELRLARAGLPTGDLLDEVDERHEAAAERLRDLDAQFAARIAALGRLVASLRAHERRERVRGLLAVPVPAADPGPDPLAGVEGRTAVVIEAYQELSGLRPQRSETRS